jgi:hypothetical protein
VFSNLLFAAAILATLAGLYLWARRRATLIRAKAAEREQAALAMMLATGKQDESEEVQEESKPKRVGRLLEDDPSEKAAAIAREAAAARAASTEVQARSLPPIEFEEQPNRNAASSAEPPNLDPIEDLISQIMVDEPVRHARPARPETPAVRPQETPVERRRDPIPSTVPLRELVLAWYESRGYRGSPASPAVWPIELVLRHREDAARAYAFVVQSDHVSVDRITALIEQAREIGMMRVAVIAEAGYERGAKEIARKRNVRLIDRATMEAELSDLQLPMAAKIIAVARKRSSSEASPAQA